VRYCLEVERPLDGRANHVLSQEMTQQMLTAGKGIGDLVSKSAGRRLVPTSLTADQMGIRSGFIAYEHHGDGAIV